MKTLLSPTTAPRAHRLARVGLAAAAVVAAVATASSAPASGAPPSVRAAAVDPTLFPIVASDDFDRANGPIGTADIGGVWETSPATTWSIVDNKAAVAPAGPGVALLQSGATDVSVSADLTVSPTALTGGAQVGLSFRALERNNQLLAGLVLDASNNRLGLFKVDAGANIPLDQVNPYTLMPGTTYHMRVDAVGADITVFLDGTAVMTYTLTPAEMTKYGSNTKHGLRSTSPEDGGSRWDNFEVRNLGAPPSTDWFTPLSPARFLDTRSANGTFDGVDAGAGVRPAGSTTEVTVRGRGGVPANAAAVVLNVTAVGPAADGFATVFPCGEAIPVASNLNYQTSEDIPNAVIAKIGANGKVCIFTDKATQLVADVNGWFGTTPEFTSLSPLRFLDTRSASGTFDGVDAGAGVRPAGSTTEVTVRGRDGVPANATAVVLNVTAVGPAADGFATVFPCGEAVPVASNLNYQAGQDIPNAVIAKIGANGKVCIFTDKATQLVADVNGWFATSTSFASTSPKRHLDTRSANGTYDGLEAGIGVRPAGSVTEVTVRARGDVPSAATAVVLNVTAVGPAADGFATVFPCGESVPVASNLNYQAGEDIPNAVIAKIGANGKVCIFTDKATHLLADVNGWFI
jgi:hypothetical protein